MSTLSVREATRRATQRVQHSDIEPPKDRNSTIARPPGISSLGLIQGFRKGPDVLDLFVADAKRHPTLSHTRLLGEHLYFLNSPDAILTVMHTHGKETIKGRGLQGAKALLGNGLLTSEGAVHLRQRRLVQPAFHRDRINRYAEQMSELTVIHEREWQEGKRVDMVQDMSALTLAIVGRTLFGSDLSGDAGRVGEALSTVLEGMGQRLIMGPAALHIPSPGRRKAVMAAAALDEVVQRLIDTHRAGGDQDDMLSMLISAQDEGSGMTDEQVRDEAMTLVLAGHETTAMTMAWGWLMLATNPVARTWLTDELDQVLAGRNPSMADLDSLPRTRATIAEILRLYPAAWVMGRRLLTDVEIDGWQIPRGAICLASQYVQQRDSRWWDQPLAFRPQRWLTTDGDFDETAPGQPRGSWFPFGWGNRRCIGEAFAWTEAALILATLGQRWTPQLVAGQSITPNPMVTLRPSPALPMTLTRR